MQKRGMLGARVLENIDLELLINHADFYIYEHQYVEFTDYYKVPHINRVRDNANIVYYIIEGGGYIETKQGNTPIEAGYIYVYPCIKEEEFQSHFYPGTKKISLYFYFDLFSCDDIFSVLRGFRYYKDEEGIIERIRDTVLSESIANQLLLPGLVMQSLTPLLKEVEDYMKERLLLGKRYHFLFDYLEKNLSHSLTLEEISQKVGMSYSTLTHTIPKKFGFNIKQYLQKKILRAASFDLEYTDLRIKDIAEKYGFSSEVYFSDWFYKMCKSRPRKYRSYFCARKQEDYCLYLNDEKTEGDVNLL